jgi:hypothetical protein
MNSPEITEFIKDYEHLFWYTPKNKKENISLEFLVETILNYGDLDAVKKLFNLLGIKKVAEIFYKATFNSERRNYFKPVINYFDLYFKRHVPQYPFS